MAEKIKKGGTIYDVISAYPKLFPPIVTQMVAIGEQTGELDNILQQLAEFYEDEVDQIMQNLPAIIEPLLILILGGGVGAMAVAIIMPMYSVTTSIWAFDQIKQTVTYSSIIYPSWSEKKRKAS